MPSNSILGKNKWFIDNIPKGCVNNCEFNNDERYNHVEDLYPSILGISDSKSETEFIIRKLNEVEYIDSLDTTIEAFDFCQTILKSLLPQVLNGAKPDQEVIFDNNHLNLRQNIVNMGDTASEIEFIENKLKELECIESIDMCNESHQMCQSIIYHILFKSVPNTANNEFNLVNLPILSRHENVLRFIEGTKQFVNGCGLHEGFHLKTLSNEENNILYSNTTEFDSEWDSEIGSCSRRETNCFLLPGKSPDTLDLDGDQFNIKSREENISITATENDNHAPQNIDKPTEATEHGQLFDKSTNKRGSCKNQITSCLPQRVTGLSFGKIMIPLTVKFSGKKVRLLKVSLKPLVETMLPLNTTYFCLGILTGVGTGYSMASMIHKEPKINNHLDI